MPDESCRLSILTAALLCFAFSAASFAGAVAWAETRMDADTAEVATSVAELGQRMKRNDGLDAAVAIMESGVPVKVEQWRGGTITVTDGERLAVVPAPEGSRLSIEGGGDGRALVLEIPLGGLDDRACVEAVTDYGGPLLTGRSHVESHDGRLLGTIDHLLPAARPDTITVSKAIAVCGDRPQSIRHVVRLLRRPA